MDKYALIISGGDVVSKKVVSKYAAKADYIIGADKGAETAYKYNLDLDIVLGDFDSINPEILEKLNCEIIKHPVEKDKTDLELSLDVLIEKSYKKIIVLNALGNRIDHTMGNLFLLEKYEDVDIRIIDNFTEIFIMKNNKVVIEDRRDYILSIIPINKKIRIEKLKGVKYPLDKKDVKRGSTLCISNIINQRECLISISEGKAFIIITNNMEDINGSN